MLGKEKMLLAAVVKFAKRQKVEFCVSNEHHSGTISELPFCATKKGVLGP